jgi:hypothetical protein
MENINNEEAIRKIRFIHKRNPEFRTFFIDGAFGGISPTGKILMDLFHTSLPIPSVMEYKLTDENMVGEELFRQQDEGFIRDFECRIVLDIEAAKLIKEWLENQIKTIEAQKKL